MKDFIILNRQNHQTNPIGKEVALNTKWSLITQGDYQDYNVEGHRVIVIGDYIGSKEEILNSKSHDIPKLKGNFYAIVIKKESIKLYNSFFSLLPIYLTEDKSMMASSIALIKENSKQVFSVDKKFILENLLFNYGFFNRTKYKEIKLLPCNHFIALNKNNAAILKHYAVANLFVEKPKSGKTVTDDLSRLFIENTKEYFPDANFHIAFTSGFDGRTLVSCATHHQKKFKTFSFGRPENPDVVIPAKNAAELDIPYDYYDLGVADYTEKFYFKNACDYTSSGYLGNGFLYAHFPYSSKKIAEESNYLISGACGSELFRALHLTGAVTSKALADIFITKDEQELREKLRTSKTLDVLNINEFSNELNELISEVIDYKNELPKNISLNQQFYIFVFEEIFRKFFGQWIVTQQAHVHVRTPFLDFNFVKALLQTKYAGANNDFFTGNPIKRVKGQYLYADIIKKTNKTIYHQITGKGYAPKSVRNVFSRVAILLPFIKKKINKKTVKPYLDNLGIISGVKKSNILLKKLIKDSLFFNKEQLYERLECLSEHTPEKERDTLLMALSILHNSQKEIKRESEKNKNKCCINN